MNNDHFQCAFCFFQSIISMCVNQSFLHTLRHAISMIAEILSYVTNCAHSSQKENNSLETTCFHIDDSTETSFIFYTDKKYFWIFQKHSRPYYISTSEVSFTLRKACYMLYIFRIFVVPIFVYRVFKYLYHILVSINYI